MKHLFSVNCLVTTELKTKWLGITYFKKTIDLVFEMYLTFQRGFEDRLRRQ